MTVVDAETSLLALLEVLGRTEAGSDDRDQAVSELAGLLSGEDDDEEGDEYEAFAAEAGFTGTLTDSIGRKRRYEHGKPVPLGDHEHHGGSGRHRRHEQERPIIAPEKGQHATAEASTIAKVGSKVWNSLPGPVRKTLVGLHHWTMIAFSKGKEMAVEMARERGFDEAKVQRIGTVVGCVDQALAWTTTFPAVTAITGNPVAGKAASFVPMASLGYLLYSTARNPLATLRAAKTILSGKNAKAAATHHAEEGGSEVDESAIAAFLDGIGHAEESGVGEDLYVAVVMVAVDRCGGDLGAAVAMAEEALADDDDSPDVGDDDDFQFAEGEESDDEPPTLADNGEALLAMIEVLRSAPRGEDGKIDPEQREKVKQALRAVRDLMKEGGDGEDETPPAALDYAPPETHQAYAEGRAVTLVGKGRWATLSSPDCFAEEDWIRDPTKRTQDRWKHVKSGRLAYSKDNPGKKKEKAAKPAPDGGKKKEEGEGGQQQKKKPAAPAKGNKLKAMSVDEAHGRISAMLADPKNAATKDAATEAISGLTAMTVAQLDELRNKLGVTGVKSKDLRGAKIDKIRDWALAQAGLGAADDDGPLDLGAVGDRAPAEPATTPPTPPPPQPKQQRQQKQPKAKAAAAAPMQRDQPGKEQTPNSSSSSPSSSVASAVLSHGGKPVSLTQLAKQTGLSVSDLHSAVQSLRKQGLLTMESIEGHDKVSAEDAAHAIKEGRDTLLYASPREGMEDGLKKAATATEATATTATPPAAATTLGPADKYYKYRNTALPDASRPVISEQERQAIKQYTGGAYHQFNKQLRAGRSAADLSGDDRAMHEGLKTAFSKVAPFEKPVRVERALDFVKKERLDQYLSLCRQSLSGGGLVEDAGFQSTSTDAGAAADFLASEHSVVLAIDARKGLDAKPYSQQSDERELLLDAGTRLRVKSISPPSEKQKNWRIEMEHVL